MCFGVEFLDKIALDFRQFYEQWLDSAAHEVSASIVLGIVPRLGYAGNRYGGSTARIKWFCDGVGHASPAVRTGLTAIEVS
jgi:hypothetical protein